MSTTQADHVTDPTGHASARSQLRVLLWVAIPFALVLLALAGYMWHAEATYTGESLGIGYVLAILAAVPAGVSLLLCLAAFMVRRRFPVAAAVCAWCAALASVTPIALVAAMGLIT